MALMESFWKMQGLLKIVLPQLWGTWLPVTIRRAMNGYPSGCRHQGQGLLFALDLQLSDLPSILLGLRERSDILLDIEVSCLRSDCQAQ